MITVNTIFCRAGTMDNYSYLITDAETKISAIIDPSETAPIVAACKKLNAQPSFVLNTHHHFDHTDSNLDMKEIFHAEIIGNNADARRIPGFDRSVTPGEAFMLGKSRAEIISVDGHTIGHILWYFPQDKILFTGDMLFNLCIGGLFEGTISQMWQSVQKIKNLPDDVVFYPGHEYTMAGANDALWFSGNAPEVVSYLENAQKRLQQGLPASPVPLGIEKRCNPYLRTQTLEEFTQILRR